MSEYTGPRVPQPPATHAALSGLSVLRAERPPADPLDVLRRIVAWRDDVHAGRVVRGAELEALIDEARAYLDLEEMRQHGNADDATEAAAHLERVRHATPDEVGESDAVPVYLHPPHDVKGGA